MEWENLDAAQPGDQPASALAREGHALAYASARGVTVLFGGCCVLGDTWEWDGTTWTQRSPAASPPARSYHALAYDAGHAVTVLFGGLGNGGSDFGDTWE